MKTCAICRKDYDIDFMSSEFTAHETFQKCVTKHLGPGEFNSVCSDCADIVEEINFLRQTLKFKIDELKAVYENSPKFVIKVEPDAELPEMKGDKSLFENYDMKKQPVDVIAAEEEGNDDDGLDSVDPARIEHLLDMSEAHMKDIETAMEEPASSNQEEAGGDDFQQPPATEVKAASRTTTTAKFKKPKVPREKQDKCEVTCETCGKFFKTKRAFARHTLKHAAGEYTEKKGLHTCEICGKQFPAKGQYQNHIRTHTGERPFQCDLCGAAFNQKANLSTHVKSKHLKVKNYACELCDKKYFRKRLLDYHMNIKHLKKPAQYGCPYCEAKFNYPGRIKRHEKVCIGLKGKVRCAGCSTYFYPGEFAIHSCNKIKEEMMEVDAAFTEGNIPNQMIMCLPVSGELSNIFISPQTGIEVKTTDKAGSMVKRRGTPIKAGTKLKLATRPPQQVEKQQLTTEMVEVENAVYSIVDETGSSMPTLM